MVISEYTRQSFAHAECQNKTTKQNNSKQDKPWYWNVCYAFKKPK